MIIQSGPFRRIGADAANARWALEMATREGAACLGREGEIGQLSIGAVADIAVWDLNWVQHAGALGDPIEALLRCGPIGARDTIVNGKFVVKDHLLIAADAAEIKARHDFAARNIQGLAES